MSDRPMLFSAPMVRALLAGTKTQTRRVLAPGNASFGSAPRDFWDHANLAAAHVQGEPYPGQYLKVPCHRDYIEVGPPCDCERCGEMGWAGTVHRLWPRIGVGDRIWVRESIDKMAEHGDAEIAYRADWPGDSRGLGWRPSIHMPKWASRLTLPVIEVRVQRLQDINDADALAEGIRPVTHREGGAVRYSGTGAKFGLSQLTPREAYASLWDDINGEDAWAENPWVVAYTFTVERRNVDAPRAAA